MPKIALTQTRLSELFNYDPDTGLFTRLTSTNNRVKIGDVAGNVRADGHVKIRVDFDMHYAHRLAWLYMTGDWPDQKIDHRDGDKSNNRFDNLRDVSVQINCQNQYSTRSASGEAGVHKTPSGLRWQAQIGVNGRQIKLGTFQHKWSASAAHLAAKILCHPEAEICKGLSVEADCFGPVALKSLRAAGFVI